MSFKLPIELDSKRCFISNTLKEDLELISTKNPDTKSVYNTILSPQTKQGNVIIDNWSNYYTTNKQFLKDSKRLYKTFHPIIDNEKIKTFSSHLERIQQDNSFDNKFQFIEWKRFQYLNTYERFLQGLSLYNFGAPLLTLLVPIIILIVPFIVLRILKIPITLSTYKQMVLQQLKNNAIARLFSDFSSVSTTRKIYLLVSFTVYVFNIYQNILTCIRFYTNFHVIHKLFDDTLAYFKYVSEQMDTFINKSVNCKSYANFIEQVRNHRTRIAHYQQAIINLHPFKILNFSKIGKKLKLLYCFKHDKDFIDTCEYSLGFIGYIDTIKGLQQNLKTGIIHFGNVKNKTTSSFNNIYHPAHANTDAVKNDITLNNNYIISGPNASGKTTLLKMIVINYILTQQFHCGFYDKANIKIVDRFHSYLNIPDTSGRDSLFQAEARRCKDIVNIIQQNPNLNHLCIFDELYSGTNPSEAIGSAYAYLVCLASRENVKFLLTTHFVKLCSLMDNHIENIKMNTIIEENDVHHSYKISKGISNVKCGFQVLKQLEYPKEILQHISSTSFE